MYTYYITSTLSTFLQLQEAIDDFTRVIHLRPDVADYRMSRVSPSCNIFLEYLVLLVQSISRQQRHDKVPVHLGLSSAIDHSARNLVAVLKFLFFYPIFLNFISFF